MKRLVLLITLLAGAACGAQNSPTNPTPGGTAAVVYAAIGASDATGFGGTVACIPFVACPDGTGYVQQVERRLRNDGRDVSLTNLGIPAAVLSPELESLGNSIGRTIPGNFLQREMPFVPRDSTLVTIFAGGNDANVIGGAVEAGLGSPDPSAYANQLVQNYGRDLRSLITGIRGRAPAARIILLNLPNLAALPYANGYSLLRRQYLQLISVGITKQANQLTSEGVTIIDLMCDDAFYDPGIFSSDGFHPNDRGYTFMADRIYPLATGGGASAPAASCGRMTIY
ncbi:MAG: SGNH/GDSL hydrolase family protein [Vicinamibacterales bacterium]